MLPNEHDKVPKMIARFADMGLQSWEMVALTGAHTVAARDDDDGDDGDKKPKSKPKSDDEDDEVPFDTTEHTWDTQFFLDTLRHHIPNGTQQIASDRAIARDPHTACSFKKYIGQQDHFNRDFTASMVKMSVIEIGRAHV